MQDVSRLDAIKECLGCLQAHEVCVLAANEDPLLICTALLPRDVLHRTADQASTARHQNNFCFTHDISRPLSCGACQKRHDFTQGDCAAVLVPTKQMCTHR